MLLANFNRKEHLRHRAVSLRQHGFLVLTFSKRLRRHLWQEVRQDKAVQRGEAICSWWRWTTVASKLIESVLVDISGIRILTLWRPLLPYGYRNPERQSARMSKITNGGLTRSAWHRMLYVRQGLWLLFVLRKD